MCGIFCSFFDTTKTCEPLSENAIEHELISLLKNRGPDASDILYEDGICFGGFVLWQQGNKVCEQPTKCGDIILLFNGDIFNIDENKSNNESDTEWLARALSQCQNDEELCSLFRTIEGPFSIIFYNKKSRCLYYGRDSLGRNSLLIYQGGSHLRILSVAYFFEKAHKSMELPPLGLYKLHMEHPFEYFIYPWSKPDSVWKSQAENLEKLVGKHFNLGEVINPKWLSINKVIKGSFNFYNICNTSTNSSILGHEILEQFLINVDIKTELIKFSSKLENSIRKRIEKTPKYCKTCVLTLNPDCNHSKVAILFSGGIDCSILAVLANEVVDPTDSIDLINVCFEAINFNGINWEAPDRLSARDSLTELQLLCPQRVWNFVEVNISREELNSMLQNHVKNIIYPLNTVLDESIGCAFWFASRGKGICRQKLYDSPARVIIVGTGADELFGGYTRHRNAYERHKGNEIEKQENVYIELEKDWQRIASRNLARDDRAVGDNGKTLRAPYLEENLVQYVRSLSPSQRCCFTLSSGLGDKLFLRIYGYHIGLRGSVLLRKKAIQFGSKIANKKQKGCEQSKFLNF